MSKRFGFVCLFVCMGILSGIVWSADSARGAEIWVASDGADTNDGTRANPLATPSVALRKAREWRRLGNVAVADGVRIILRGGDFRLREPLFVRPEDSGTASAPTVFEAAPGEKPVLSGGVPVEGWRPAEAQIAGLPVGARGRVWVADAPVFNGRALEFRQLWVDGRRAVRAREPDGEEMVRLAGWDRVKEEAWVPAGAAGGSVRRLAGVEMVLHQQWEIAVLRMRSWEAEGDRARVTFHQPESRIQFEHPWPQPICNPDSPARNSGFFLVGALEFLDEPGEWVQESPGGRVFYWPREGENLAAVGTGAPSQVIAPALETIVEVTGSLDRPVAHVQFRGIGFAHTTWLRPSVSGHVPHQAGMFMLDAYQLHPRGTPDWRSLDNQAWIGRPPAAVEVSGAHHIRFERCRFEHTAMSGLDFRGGTRDDTIEGCTFRDIGNNGLQMGSYGEPGIEIHLPFDPADERAVCTRERIANNLFDDTACEDWGGIALSVGWAREVTIEHNEILRTSYTGISLGWGWTRTPNTARRHVVRANRIHRFATRMADCAGIYLLSAQPGSVVSENAISAPVMTPWVHDPQHWGYVYLDEGSSFTLVRDNWCPAEKFIKNANGPGNAWENNGPAVAAAVKDAAGLEPAFQNLLR